MGCGFKSLKNAETNDHKVPAHDFLAIRDRPTLTKGASATLVPAHWNPLSRRFFFFFLQYHVVTTASQPDHLVQTPALPYPGCTSIKLFYPKLQAAVLANDSNYLIELLRR